MKSTEGQDDTSWEPEIGYPPDLPESEIVQPNLFDTTASTYLTMKKMQVALDELGRTMAKQFFDPNIAVVSPTLYDRLKKLKDTDAFKLSGSSE